MELKEQLVERLINYAEDIVKGKIVASKKHKQACQRFLNDIKQIPKKKYPYYFDADEVERFYHWSRCFKHTKGLLSGTAIELDNFQLFIAANIFGWKKKENGHRRFRKSFIMVARKNSKSQLLALLTSYECFLSKEQAECYVAGSTREQSSIVYNEIAMQLRQVPMLRTKYKEAYGKITHKRTGSIIMPLSKQAKKSGDGKNPSFVVIDEYHAHPSSEIYDVLDSGMVARPSGHICIISTAGLSLNQNPCYLEYQYAARIIDPNDQTSAEEYFVLIAEIDEGDNPQDINVWAKANPIVCSYPEGVEEIRNKLQAALDAPDKMHNFLTKNMNVWVNGGKKNTYLALDKWAACREDISLEDFRGQPCIIGADLSATTDLTSIGIIFERDGKLFVFSHSFMPEDTVEKKTKTDKVPYKRWIEEGHITETIGGVVHYSYIQKHIEGLVQQYDIKVLEFCSDPWNATHILQEMEEAGFTTVEIRQGMQTLTYPTKNFRERVFLKTIAHDGNPVLEWAVGNAQQRKDHNENIMLDKDKSTERIDPIAAVINAHVRTSTIESENSGLLDWIMSDDFSF